ncbi:MAG: hypothetical protein WCR04_02850 [Fibrobacteraceae bacterium]
MGFAQSPGLSNAKASFAAVFGFCNSRLSKWRRTPKPSISGSELVRYQDLRPEADAEGINTESMYASRYPCGSVIQPSKLGCATLALHGFDASRHPCDSVIQPSKLERDSQFGRCYRPQLHLGNKGKQACLCCA